MAGLLRASFGGALLAALLAANLKGADAPVRFRSQGVQAVWGNWGMGGDGNGGDWDGGHSLLSFSPDSKYLLRRLDDSTLVLWDLADKREAAKFGHIAVVQFARFSPDSRQLLVALGEVQGQDEKSQVVLWNLKEQAIVRRFEEDRIPWDAEFSHDGRLIATSTHSRHKADPQPNKVVVWGAATGEEVATLKVEKRGREHRAAIAWLQFSADGKWLLTSTTDGATIWDAATWERVRLLTGSSGTYPAIFSPDSKFVFSACQARSSNVPLGVRVWSVETGKIVASTTFDLSYKEEKGACWFTLAPDGTSLVTAAWVVARNGGHHLRSIMKHWNAVSGQEIVLQGRIGDRFYWWGAARFSPDGATLAFVPWQAPRPEVTLLDSTYWLKGESFDMRLPEDEQIPAGAWLRSHALQFSPDGRWLAATRDVPRSREHEVFLWSLETNRQSLADRGSNK